MVSSKDVAKLAGVSQPTVSRVLNNPDSVKPEKKAKVLKAMEELGYYPNLIARSLVTRSTRTIALISGTLKNGFFVETTDSIVHLAGSKGYKTTVYFEDENRVPDFFDSVLGQKVDGILLSLIKLDDPVLERIERSNIPCVFFNRKPRSGGHYVVLDNYRAAAVVTRHMLDLGHTRIAYISGETDVSTFHERQYGFADTMREAGVGINAEWVRFIDGTADEVARLTFRLLQKPGPERPTAILCATDTMALACMDTILSMGLRIPEDVSLAGIDNISLAAHQAVQLTTVGHSKFAMGEIAAETLIDLIQGQVEDGAFRQITLPPELLPRKTTAPLQGR